MRYFTFISLGIIFFISQYAFSQQMPLDFSAGQDNFVPFGSSSFAKQQDPVDASNEVGEFTNTGSDIWEGFYLDLSNPIDLDVQKTITLDFYQFDPNSHQITLKLEMGANPDVEVRLNTVNSGWKNEISFDFSNAVLSSDGTTSINASGTYNRLTIFIDGGVASSGTYFVDNINDGSTPSDPHALDVLYSDLVWSDEFDSTTPEAIDASKWHHQTFGPNGGRWFNNEEQHYTNRLDNSYMENGFLNIVAKKENFTQNGVTLPYTSARLNSKFAFTYGRIDIRAKLPAGTDGTWPAIWTLGKNISETGAYWQTQGFGTTTWPDCGEIDIMEHGLYDATNETSCAIHTPSSSGATVNTAKQVFSDVTTNFHVFSVNWSPNQITFLVDNVGYYTYNPPVKNASTWPFNLDQFLLLNVAMGGVSGAISPSFTESSMVIDYVRVYQNLGLSTGENEFRYYKLFPNPTKDTLLIESKINIDKIEVYTLSGKKVLTKDNPKHSLNVSTLKTGVYLIFIHSENNTTTQRFIKQ